MLYAAMEANPSQKPTRRVLDFESPPDKTEPTNELR